MPIIGAITRRAGFLQLFHRTVEGGQRRQPGRREKQGAVLAWGNFLTLTLNFIIIALCCSW